MIRRWVFRAVVSALILLAAFFAIYALMRALPTSYVESLAASRASKPGSGSYAQWLDSLNTLYGFDESVPLGFVRWLSSALRGDFGESWYYNMPVTEKFFEVIGDSAALTLSALLLECLIAIPLGILSAKRKRTAVDWLITALSLVLISMPLYFLSGLFKFVFAEKLGIFELFGKYSRFYSQMTPLEKFGDIVRHFTLPAVTLALSSVGFLTRFVRSNMLEALSSSYVRASRSRGIPERTVLFRHAFRNTLLPLVTLMGSSLPSLFSGAMVTEAVFQLPGIGYTSYLAILGGDIPFSMFFLSFVAVLTFLGSLLSDLLYAAVDPRVRGGGKV